MRLLDRSNMQDLFYRGKWYRPSPPEPMVGGEIVDQAARRAIEELIAALIAGGILPSNETPEH
jgi:hypothetical protein